MNGRFPLRRLIDFVRRTKPARNLFETRHVSPLPMSTIHFIGGEKGGVGKSVVARLVAQYCIDKAIAFTAIDADASHGALLRYYGDYAKSVDLYRPESVDVILELATEG